MPKQINLSKNSYLLIYDDLPDNIKWSEQTFNKIWNIMPQEDQKIIIFGKQVNIPRKQALFSNNNNETLKYTFSGKTVNTITPIPEEISKLIEYVNTIDINFNYNGAFVNWYKDGDNYIGQHSDDEKDLNNKAPIYSFTFCENYKDTRIFRIHNKTGKKVLDINTTNNLLLSMCGDTQLEFKHSVPKTKKPVGKRINITIRAFKN